MAEQSTPSGPPGRGLSGENNPTTREPQTETILYPGAAGALEQQVRSFLNTGAKQTPPDISNTGKGHLFLGSPHGSYLSTGPVMGNLFGPVARRTWERIIIFAPVHREQSDSVFLPRYTRFATPLGDVPVDTETVLTLNDKWDGVCLSDTPHIEEHAIELQLPFIQTLYPGVPIVPLLTGSDKKEVVRSVTGIVEWLLSYFENALFILSSNLSAYKERAAAGRDTERLELAFRKRENLLALYKKGEISPCGIAFLQAVLDILPETAGFQLLSKTEHTDDRGENGLFYGAFTALKC